MDRLNSEYLEKIESEVNNYINAKVLKIGPNIEPDKLLIQRFNGLTGVQPEYIYNIIFFDNIIN